ncbi:MAG: hypothetical protein DI630_18700 [Gordonia sp. (in: high G+C Gram-positive bacteria)]|nr:MAG: hypothetical protein DI630_18700 [Gordonia sp. (in: high G+C Gram-positive bacteria)]
MAAEDETTTWLTDATGLLIAVRVLRRPDGPVVRLSVPSTGYTTDITAERAPRVLDMLQRGIAFTDITGSSSFRVDETQEPGPSL